MINESGELKSIIMVYHTTPRCDVDDLNDFIEISRRAIGDYFASRDNAPALSVTIILQSRDDIISSDDKST